LISPVFSTRGVHVRARESRCGKQILLALGAALCCLPSAFAESDVRSRLGVSDRVRNYNFKVGELTLDFEARAITGGSDNGGRLSSGGESNTWLEYGLDTRIYWPISPDVTLDTVVYIGYVQTTSGDGPEGLVVRASEGIGMALDWRLGDSTLLSLTDTLTIDVDSNNALVDDELVNSRLLSNYLALQLESDITRWTRGSLHAAREDVRSLDSEFEYRDRVGYILGGELMRHINRRTSVGPYISWRTYEHVEEQRNDATDFELGARLRRQLSATTSIDVSAAWQTMDFAFDNAPGVTDEKLDDVTWALALTNRPRRNVSQSLTLKQYQRLGTSVGFNGTDDFTVGYRFDWDMSRYWHVTLLSRYIDSDRLEESAVDADEEQWSNEIILRYSKGPYSLFCGYRHTRRWSDFGSRDFATNDWSMGIGYDF
jgi:hypothetical protein